MKPSMTLFVLLCIAHGLTLGLTLALGYNGHWMGATALLAVSLLVLGGAIRIMRALRCART